MFRVSRPYSPLVKIVLRHSRHLKQQLYMQLKTNLQLAIVMLIQLVTVYTINSNLLDIVVNLKIN